MSKNINKLYVKEDSVINIQNSCLASDWLSPAEFELQEEESYFKAQGLVSQKPSP